MIFKSIFSLNAGADLFHLLVKCLSDVKQWMFLNFFRSNGSKTELVMFGNSCRSDSFLGPMSSYLSQQLKILEFILIPLLSYPDMLM